MPWPAGPISSSSWTPPNDSSAPEITFDLGTSTDLPVVW